MLEMLAAYRRGAVLLGREQGRLFFEAGRFNKTHDADQVGRVLNRLVAERRPASLALERLEVRNPALSRRLDAILRNGGRSVIEAKLADLEQHHGVTSPVLGGGNS